MATSALLELPKYAATDEDLDPSFFPNGAPSAQAIAVPPSLVFNFELQAARWLEGLRTRDCDPVAPSTLATFESRVKTILSVIGPQTRLEDFKNAAMAKFVQDAKRFRWAPSTLADHILVIKLIISSATDAEGEEIFPRVWKRRVINAPRVERDKQHTPCLTRDEVETLLRKAKTEQERLIYAFLCGSGLRISEAQGVRVNSDDEEATSWNPQTATVSVRNSFFRGKETGRVKTRAARREVILCSELNQALIAFTTSERRADGVFLFQGKDGKPFRQSTLRYQMAQHVKDAAPHGCRRHYISWLRKNRVQEDVIRKQAGHAAESVTDLYSCQDEAFVRSEIERAGLSFSLVNSLASDQAANDGKETPAPDQK